MTGPRAAAEHAAFAPIGSAAPEGAAGRPRAAARIMHFQWV